MTARHLAWAREATGGTGRSLKQFDLLTSVWGHYDPVLAAEATETLKLLGFNVMGGVPDRVLRRTACGPTRPRGTWWPIREESAEALEEGRRRADRQEPGDRGRPVDLREHGALRDRRRDPDDGLPPRRPREAQRLVPRLPARAGETDASLGRPIAQVEYPAEAMYAKTLPRDADLPTRKIHYYAASSASGGRSGNCGRRTTW